MKYRAEKSHEAKDTNAYRAALQHAIRAGIPETKLMLGIGLRDGIFGERDTAGALKIFDDVDRETADGLRAGDPVAMYVNAQMLREGLGRQSDRLKAVEIARRAALQLDGWRLDQVTRDVVFGGKFFEGKSDLSLGKQLADRMIDPKLESGPAIGASTCNKSDLQRYRACAKSWYQRAVEAGIGTAIPGYADSLVANGDSLNLADQWYGRGEAHSEPEHRFSHAFVRAILSTDDASLLKAMADMLKHKQSDAKSIIPMLSDGTGLISFFDRVKLMSPIEADNFLVALATYGLLTERLRETMYDFWLSTGRDDLLVQLRSAKIQNSARIAADAIRSGISLEAVSLQRTNGFRFYPLKEAASKEPKVAARIDTDTVKPGQVNSTVKPVDREQQDRTGYIKGEPRGAVGGLSTFTVDNRRGDQDVVARIYLNGAKPAVRHLYVKKGETFKAETIQPGSYVFRYRQIGSEDTFEATNPFELTQIESEKGTHFSNVMVTLFKVKDGNMQTRKVDSSKF